MKLLLLILLLRLQYLSNLCYAQNSSSVSVVYLNSTNPLIWHNNNSTMFFNGSAPNGADIRVLFSVSVREIDIRFVCGFYCLYHPETCYFSVMAVSGEPTVVWSANRNNPVEDDATLQLTRDGDLVLRNSDGVKAWSTGTAGKSVIGMNMTQEGNLILFNNKGSVVWQSFDHPTDTLLIGQRLYPGQQLTSSYSETNWSTGIYSAMVSSTSDFVAYTRVDRGPPLMYYRMVGDPDEYSIIFENSSIYAELQIGEFIVNRGNGEETYINYNTPFPIDRSVFFLKLHSNGRIKIYSINEGSIGLNEGVDLVSQELGECQYPRRCGDFGLCRQGQCSCPIGDDGTRYFEQAQFQLLDEGCLGITPLSCRAPIDQQHLVRVNNVTYFNTIDAKAAVPNIKDKEGCKRACAQNCSCTAAFFRYEKNVSHGYCFLSSNVLSIRERNLGENYFTDTYIKVRIPYVAPSSVRKKRRLNLAAVVVSGSSVGGFIVMSVAIAIVLRMQKGKPNDEEEYMSHIPGMPSRFSYEDLRLATDDFKENIGTGGFGTVFRGVLGDGTQVAVKRLDKLSHGTKEFLAEVQSIGSIHHFNLVRLIGYCAEKSSRFLVYEFMVNGSLDNWIFNKRDQQYHSLDWPTRKKIILDIAKGLAYLHEECRQRIIHLDIKPQNILLDENFKAKVSDFGLAKLMDRDESQVQTTMRGTPGYIAPEWRLLRITVKVDIYSFGIVVLEIVCGRKNLDRKRSEASSHLLRLLKKKQMRPNCWIL